MVWYVYVGWFFASVAVLKSASFCRGFFMRTSEPKPH
jgi:hypothetical protein